MQLKLDKVVDCLEATSEHSVYSNLCHTIAAPALSPVFHNKHIRTHRTCLFIRIAVMFYTGYGYIQNM